MKAYKTWEVMKMLSENPKLKFEQRDEEENDVVRILISKYGYVMFDNENCSNELNGNILIDGKWTLIQEPISFMVAMEALKKGKRVTVELNGIAKGFRVVVPTNDVLIQITISQILYGKWYIEEGENNEASKQTTNS